MISYSSSSRVAIIILLAFFFLMIPKACASACLNNLTIIPKSFVQNETIKFKFSLGGNARQNLSIEYWVEDTTGNILKAKRQSSSLDWKTFTPKTNQQYSVYSIKAAIVQPSGGLCPEAEQLVVFKTQANLTDTEETGLICRPLKKGISIYLEHAPLTAIAGEPFSILVGIENHDNQTHELELYSYIYRASKSYSGARTQNLKEIKIGPAEAAEYELINTVNSSIAIPGEYKLKVIALYSSNKTRELTTNITVVDAHDYSSKAWISDFGLDSLSSQELVAEINSTLRDEAQLRLVLESDTDISEAELILALGQSAKVRFPLALPLERNHLFLKLYQNSTLLDISELVLENTSAKAKAQKPFSLVSGDIILNSSENRYLSSSSKATALVPFILLAASLIANLYFIIFKKKE